MNNLCEFYDIWSERMVLSDCLSKLGLPDMANEIHTGKVNQDIINTYVKIAHKLALTLNDNDVIERLCITGLIYG